MSKHKSKEFLDSGSESDGEQKKSKKLKVEEKKPKEKKSKSDEDDGSSGWELGKKKKITISNFKGKTFVDIREYYEKDGELLPGRKGISLTTDQWELLKEFIPKIDKAMGK